MPNNHETQNDGLHDSSRTGKQKITNNIKSTTPAQLQNDGSTAIPELSSNTDLPPLKEIQSSLPIYLKLVGISETHYLDPRDDRYSEDKDDVIVMVQFDNKLHTHSLFDYISNSNIQIVAIVHNAIEVNYEDRIYTIELSEPNLLAADFVDSPLSDAQLLSMTSEEISTRPRMIEHLVSLTATPYIADGKIVSKGTNPALFEQAGFKVDDVLKTVNGKRVTVASEYAEIQKELKTALMLEFTVMRKGRLIDLYLDIPSETLEVLPE